MNKTLSILEVYYTPPRTQPTKTMSETLTNQSMETTPTTPFINPINIKRKTLVPLNKPGF